MSFLVCIELRFPAEGFVTFRAFIRFFSRVSSLVFHEPGLPGECFVTQAAPMRFLSCMNSLMINEPRLLDKAFSTIITYVGLLTCMSFQDVITVEGDALERRGSREGIRLLVDPAPETGGREGTRIKKRLSVCAAHGDGPWWPPGEAWLSKQSPQAAEGAPALQSPQPTHAPHR